jgi:hypothetical protein
MPDPPATVTPAPESAKGQSYLDQLQLSGQYTRLPGIRFRDEASFDLRDAAADYARLDYEAFLDAYATDALFRAGIIDAASYIIGETLTENLVGGSTLVFGPRYQTPVASEIGIGAPVSAILDLWGEPDFARQNYELIGYKTATFYIAFTGAERVQRIYLSRRYPQGELDDVFPDFLASDNPGNYPFDKHNMAATQLWRASYTYYSPSGLCVWNAPRSTDESFDYYYPAYIYKDYTGQVPEGAGEDTDFFFLDADYPEYKIFMAIAEEKAIQQRLDAGLEPEYYSPDKSVAVLPFDDCAYERSGFLFRRLDGGLPDRFIRFGHFPDKPLWLNSRYVCVNTMLGFGIYDLGSPYPGEDAAFYIDEVFYIQDDSYAGLTVVEPSGQGEALALRGDKITVCVDATQTPLELKDDEQLMLRYQFSADGALLAEYSIVKR